MNTGKRIKELREKYKLTQIELSSKMRIPQSTLVGYEKRYDNNSELIEKVCNALNISMIDFYNINNGNIQYDDNTSKNETLEMKELKEAYKINPESLITLCRASKELPPEKLKSITDYAAYEMEQFLKKRKK